MLYVLNCSVYIYVSTVNLKEYVQNLFNYVTQPTMTQLLYGSPKGHRIAIQFGRSYTFKILS